MTLKAIGIAGSPRKRGNSATLLAAALEGAASAGADTEVVRLEELTFRGCQGCEPCTADASCRVDDELTPVLAKVRASDVWLLAAPIYFDGVCGQMKLFFDRLHHLVSQSGQRKALLRGRRTAAIIISYEDKPRAEYLDVARRMAAYLSWMGDFAAVEILDGCRLGPSDAAAGSPEVLARARGIGKMLVERLTGAREPS